MNKTSTHNENAFTALFFNLCTSWLWYRPSMIEDDSNVERFGDEIEFWAGSAQGAQSRFPTQD
jgi:hypothetical protein